jgi:hypothetical protein
LNEAGRGCGGRGPYSRSPHRPAIPLAERLRRALDRIDSARVPRSCDHLARSRFAARPEVLLRNLRAVADSLIVGQGRSNQPTDPASGPGQDSRASAGWRVAPSLRTNRGLTGWLLFRHTLSSCRATRLSRRTSSTQRSEIFTLNLVTSQNSEEFCVVKDGRWAFW